MKVFLKLVVVLTLGIIANSQIHQEEKTPEDIRPYIEFTTEVFEEPENPPYYDYQARINKPVKFFNENYFLRDLNTERIDVYVDGVKQDSFTNTVTFNTLGEHTVKYVIPDGLNTMNYMCYQTFHITKVKFSNLDTSRVQYAGRAFDSCYNLKEFIGLEDLDFSSIIDVDSMFAHCSSLETINIGNMIGPTMQNLGFLFIYCTQLKSIQWGTVDTSHVQYMYQTFSNCYELQEVDLSDWDMSACYNFNEIFWDNRECEVTFKNEAQYNIVKAKYPQLDTSVKTIKFKE